MTWILAGIYLTWKYFAVFMDQIGEVERKEIERERERMVAIAPHVWRPL